ncbi:MAG TPA: hypothetical protein VFY93_08315 [Planctomycetota bacterium]|nr:hypothetical protein [Planctomycetota bacterium]
MNGIGDAHRAAAGLARRSFHDFVSYVGRDENGDPIDQRPLDRLVWDFVEECHAARAPAGVMLPMGHGKTSQFCYRAAFEIGRDPNVLITVVTDSLDNSKERVELIRKVIDLPEYRRTFPGVKVVAGKDERQRFTVERTGLAKEPTVAAEGVLTGTGLRTTFLLLDDVVTQRNALLEPTNRKRVLDAIRLTWMSRSRLGGERPVRVAWIQTAYHQADAATVLREDPDSGWRWLVVRAEPPYDALSWERWERGVLVARGAVESPFPAEAIAERARQMGPTAAARGLANRPVSGEECPFREEHFEGPTPLAPERYHRRIVFADPAGDATKARHGNSDYCGVVAIGKHPDGCWEVFGAARMRGSPSQQAAFIAGRVALWKPHSLFQEAVKDEALVGVTQKALRDIGAYVPVQPVKPLTNKEIRIVQTLEPALAASPPLLRVCGRLFPALREEALTFPAGAHDDLLDALEGAFSKARGSGPMRHRSSHTPRPPGAGDEETPERRRRREFRRVRIWERRGRVFDRW